MRSLFRHANTLALDIVTLFSEISTDAALAMPAMAVLMFFVGASIGSFLNVVVYRVPAGLSIVRPASRCPNCSTPIRSTDNVPVFGWLRLRGRCRACGQPISAPIRSSSYWRG